MENQQYTPTPPTQTPNGRNAGQAPNGTRQAQTAAPNGQNTYNTGAYGQNPYGTRPPYGQNSYTAGAYGQPPYSTPYAQNPNTSPYAQQPPYSGTPYGNPYGYNAGFGGAPYSGYTPPDDPSVLKKKSEVRTLRSMSMAHGLAVVGFTVFAFVFSAFLALIPGFREAYTENTLFSEAVDAAFSIFIIFIPFFLCYLFQKKRGFIKELPLGTPNDGKAAVLLVFIGLMCCVAGSYASGILGSMLENIFGVTFTLPETDTVYNTVPRFLLATLGTAFVPAFVEEFAVRGAVMQPLRKYGDKFAVLMSALVFALMHGNMVQIPFAFIAGIAIGYAVTVSGSMWVGVAIHFLNNFMSILMQVAVDNLPDRPENAVLLGILALIFTVGIASLVIYLKVYARTPLSDGASILSNGEKSKAYICTVPMILAVILLLVETAQYIEF